MGSGEGVKVCPGFWIAVLGSYPIGVSGDNELSCNRFVSTMRLTIQPYRTNIRSLSFYVIFRRGHGPAQPGG